MAGFVQGPFGVQSGQGQVRDEVYEIAINWFSNRCPLVTRAPRLPVGSTRFQINTRTFRPRNYTCGASFVNTDTSITLVDASPLMIGDILMAPSNGEQMEVTADPNLSTNVITVRRGIGTGTVPAAANSNGSADVLFLVGNSRSGDGEKNQKGITFKPVNTTQWCQTWIHPVQVSGSLESSSAFQTEPAVPTPFAQVKMDAMQNLMDDEEVTTYYGLGEDGVTSGNQVRNKQKGLRTLIVTNKTTSPTNAGAYKPTDFIHDTLEKCRTGGGAPDVLLLSTNFMTGLATWGHAAQRIDAGTNKFGLPIDVFEAPFLNGITIVEAPLLKPFSAICLTSSEFRMRYKRNEFSKPRGSQGDVTEEDLIAEGACELDNEAHHAWLEGVTAFSAT